GDDADVRSSEGHLFGALGGHSKVEIEGAALIAMEHPPNQGRRVQIADGADFNGGIEGSQPVSLTEEVSPPPVVIGIRNTTISAARVMRYVRKLGVAAHKSTPIPIATFHTPCYRSFWEVSPRAPHLKESNEQKLDIGVPFSKCVRSR